MKKLLSLILILISFSTLGITVFAKYHTIYAAELRTSVEANFKVEARSALLMEAGTGKILFAQNENEAASPASVTKIMTLLLVMEAIEEEKISLDDTLTVSEYAASMGGSQIFLEEGEMMSVKELIKCTVIASANDAAVALAEAVGGNEKNFVSMMNKRAAELEMDNTNFENVTGLDDTTERHLTTAKDIAIMSRELIKFDLITEFSSLWQDTIRDGEFTLTNTNRLVRYYDGCNGLKTGSTDKAGYCISATAKRDGMQLIAVVMGADTRDKRNNAAKQLLDFGFSSYTVYSVDKRSLENIPVYSGEKNITTLYSTPFSCIIPKGQSKNVNMTFEIPETLTAPISEKQIVGSITYMLDDEILGRSDIYVEEGIEKIKLGDIILKIIKNIFFV